MKVLTPQHVPSSCFDGHQALVIRSPVRLSRVALGIHFGKINMCKGIRESIRSVRQGPRACAHHEERRHLSTAAKPKIAPATLNGRGAPKISTGIQLAQRSRS
jgi:hypothetical protein